MEIDPKRITAKIGKKESSISINLEGLSVEEQMQYFIKLSDLGLIEPCPKEIRDKYCKE